MVPASGQRVEGLTALHAHGDLVVTDPAWSSLPQFSMLGDSMLGAYNGLWARVQAGSGEHDRPAWAHGHREA